MNIITEQQLIANGMQKGTLKRWRAYGDAPIIQGRQGQKIVYNADRIETWFMQCRMRDERRSRNRYEKRR